MAGVEKENAEFGLRAAAAAPASNESLFEQRIIHWGPARMESA
jgi:hypothetical protein